MPGAGQADTAGDFSVVDDHIDLENAAFALSGGPSLTAADIFIA